MSVSKVTGRVRRALALLEQARELVRQAAEYAEDFFTTLGDAVAGTTANSSLDALQTTHAEVEDQVAGLLAGIDRVHALADAHLTHLVGHLATAPATRSSTGGAQGGGDQAAGPAAVAPATTSRAGDSYPDRASWAMPLVMRPYSPVRSGVPVEGYVRPTAPPSEATLPFNPGGGRWFDAARDRLRELGAPPWAQATASHIEMQVAAWMIESGVQGAELVLNREPCGERGGRGCHQALRAFLPVGYRLAVSGTRGGRRAYQYDYEGTAEP